MRPTRPANAPEPLFADDLYGAQESLMTNSDPIEDALTRLRDSYAQALLPVLMGDAMRHNAAIAIDPRADFVETEEVIAKAFRMADAALRARVGL
jgi:hypothetical protein